MKSTKKSMAGCGAMSNIFEFALSTFSFTSVNHVNLRKIKSWNEELVYNRHWQRIALSDLRRGFVDQSATKERHRSQDLVLDRANAGTTYRYLYLYRRLGIRAQRCSCK